MDRYAFTGRSKPLRQDHAEVRHQARRRSQDIDGRKVFLDWLVAKNIRGHAEVSNQVREFYGGPYAVINKAKVEEIEGLRA